MPMNSEFRGLRTWKHTRVAIYTMWENCTSRRLSSIRRVRCFRCKIIRRFFSSSAYDLQCRLIGSHSWLFCGNLCSLRFPRIFAVIARKTFLRDAGKKPGKIKVKFQNARVVSPVLNSMVSECPWARTQWNVVRRGTAVDSFDGQSRSRLVTGIFLEVSSRGYIPVTGYTIVLAWIECDVTDLCSFWAVSHIWLSQYVRLILQLLLQLILRN